MYMNLFEGSKSPLYLQLLKSGYLSVGEQRTENPCVPGSIPGGNILTSVSL